MRERESTVSLVIINVPVVDATHKHLLDVAAVDVQRSVVSVVTD